MNHQSIPNTQRPIHADVSDPHTAPAFGLLKLLMVHELLQIIAKSRGVTSKTGDNGERKGSYILPIMRERLMKKNWNYEQNQFKHKGRSLTLKECEMYGVRLSVETLKRYAAEMKAQEAFAKKEWKDNGRVLTY